MSKFALLLNHSADRYEAIPEDEYMDIIKDYVSWVQTQVEKGIYVGGHKLQTSAGKRLTKAPDGIDVVDAPSTEIAEILGGIMIIDTKDMAAAVEVARSHPHFVHNQSLEIWPLDEAVDNED
ncbi:MAG: YciI family protein [Pseudomonadales bacterium]